MQRAEMLKTHLFREKPLVLAADDDLATRFLLRKTLERADFTVAEASDGESALKVIQDQQPDIVLLDVLMPKLDGFAVCAEMRKDVKTQNIPVLMVTGLGDIESIRKAYHQGATDFITKPINWQTLGYHISYLLRATRAFSELEENRAFFNTVLEDIPVFVCRWAPDGTISYVNEAYCSYFGHPAEKLIGSDFKLLVPEGDWDKVARHVESLSPENPVSTHEHRAVRGDGNLRWQRWTNRALFDDQGAITEFQSIGEDITEKKQTEEKLLLAREVFEKSDELIAITDVEANIIDVNPAFTRLTGYARDKIIGQNMRLLKFETQGKEFYAQNLPAIQETGRWQGEVRGRHKNGRCFSSLMTLNILRNEAGEPTHFVSISTDISQLKQTEKQLRHLAYYDNLTGLPNRDLMRDRLTQALHEAARAGTKVGLLFLDLDYFKDINDTMGHPLGDQVLTQVAHRLKRRTRQSDTVARVGGDEFVFVLRNVIGSEGVSIVANGVMEALAKPIHLDGKEVFITASLGAAIFPEEGETADDLIQKADTAMYHAKSNGRNRFQFFSKEMNLRLQERMAMQIDLRQALKKNQFLLHFQPKIDLFSGDVVGLEALLRWQKSKKELVPPDRFIPLAEETGLIVPIGEEVLRQACALKKVLELEGLPGLPVAVNISAVQLRQKDLVDTVAGILRQSGLDPALLELEITETAIMQDTEKAVAMLETIREMGIHVTMDDFGTGYSSLSYLKKFPVSTLKIDRFFLQEGLSPAGDTEIIRAIIAMARRIGLKVVAEGVETESQAKFLRREKCDQAQGYFFARPMPPKDLIKWMKGRKGSEAT